MFFSRSDILWENLLTDLVTPSQTAQLRLENATLSRRAKIAEELAKKFQTEKNAMAKEVEELRQELEAARRSRAQGPPDSGDESKDVNSGVCNMVKSR